MSEAPSPTIIFTGPSLSAREAAGFGTCAPPAKRGDIFRAVEKGARRIVLIDGEMIYNAPPTPHELRQVLRDGIEIFGAASLGALRAVELFDEGMMGIGWIYSSYLSRRVDSDDELLSILDPSTHIQLTVPLINVRYGLQCASKAGSVSAAQVADLMAALRGIHFQDRTKPALVAAATVILGTLPADVEKALTGQFNIKRADALNCLRFASLAEVQ